MAFLSKVESSMDAASGVPAARVVLRAAVRYATVAKFLCFIHLVIQSDSI
jgi:hypothetical protein